MIRKRLKSAARSVLNRLTGRIPASSGITILDGATDAPPDFLSSGWRDREIAARQQSAFRAVLAEMYAGRVREDFAALAAMMREIRMQDPAVIEVGSGSGWNGEVMRYLLGGPIRYTGVDYSEWMTRLGKTAYPGDAFIVGDAAELPLADASCDVLLSGTVLMHVLRYEDAIRESRRVSRRWCLFHTIPVLRVRDTTMIRKHAYGVPVVEIVFNEARLLRSFEAFGLRRIKTVDSIPHRYLDGVVGEPVPARTYLCERA
jgi:SAM-dependent methyltransferase